MPLWSVMIPTYNSERHLAETLESVLRCNVPEEEMQITVVDNCSTDGTKEIVDRIGGDRVEWIQNSRNIGMVANFNKCVEYAQGDWIHILNSDDLVRENFYREFAAIAAQYPEVHLISCVSTLIDDEGNIIGKTPDIPTMNVPSKDIRLFMYDNPFRTPAVVVHKEAYARLGMFDTSLTFCIDWEMWVRVIHHLSGIHLCKELCFYRDGGYNTSTNAVRLGESTKDTYRLFRIFARNSYPINLNQAEKNLRLLSRWYYHTFMQRGDRLAAKANKDLYLDHSGFLTKLVFEGKEFLKLLTGRYGDDRVKPKQLS